MVGFDGTGTGSLVGQSASTRFVRDRKPDGGWGWMVTLGTFIVFVITTGSSWAFGILYIAFLDAFNQSKAITAVPGSLIFMTMVVTNPYAGLLADKYGHRPVIFVGGVVSTLAIFASSFATDFTMLTIMYGLIGGIGFGLSHMPAVVMLSIYFDTKIGTATGLAMSGTGLGTIFMSIVTQYLVNEYGWRGTMLVLSAINANLCLAAAVMRPVKLCLRLERCDDEVTKIDCVRTTGINEITYKELPQEDNADTRVGITENPLLDPEETNGVVQRTKLPTNCIVRQDSRTDINCNGDAKGLTHHHKGATPNSIHGTKRGCEKAKETEGYDTSRSEWCLRRILQQWYAFFDSVYGFVLWKNPMYLSFLTGINLAFFGMTIVSAHVAKRALEYGIHDTHSSSLVAVMGLSQAAGRLISGPLVDRCRLNPLRLYQSMSAMCGIAIIFGIYFKSFPAQVAFCGVAGYATGACATLQTVMCVSLFGQGRMKYAYPGVILAVGIAMLTSPPIAGLCRDMQGNYVGAFLMAAASCFSSVVAHLPLSCTIKPGKKSSRTPMADDDEFQQADELVSKV